MRPGDASGGRSRPAAVHEGDELGERRFANVQQPECGAQRLDHQKARKPAVVLEQIEQRGNAGRDALLPWAAEGGCRHRRSRLPRAPVKGDKHTVVEVDEAARERGPVALRALGDRDLARSAIPVFGDQIDRGAQQPHALLLD